MKFLADDGKVFENRTECEKYEKEIGIRRLNHKCITMPLPFVETSTGFVTMMILSLLRNFMKTFMNYMVLMMMNQNGLLDFLLLP